MGYIITLGQAEIDNLDEILQIIRKLGANELVQVLNSNLIISEKQIEYAAQQTKQALDQKYNIANNQNTEFLLRLSGKRQVKQGLNDFGIKQGKQNIVIYASQETTQQIIEQINFIVDETILDLTKERKEKIIKHYGITKKALEISNLEKLVLEQIASLGLEE